MKDFSKFKSNAVSINARIDIDQLGQYSFIYKLFDKQSSILLGEKTVDVEVRGDGPNKGECEFKTMQLCNPYILSIS